MRSFHFDRAAPAGHFSHRRSGARHRIRANSTVIFYEPFECPTWAFFRRPLIFLATVLLFTVDYRLQCASCFDNARDKGRIRTVYIRCSDLFLSLHRTLRYEIIICHDNENERRVVLLSIFCRAIRENRDSASSMLLYSRTEQD